MSNLIREGDSNLANFGQLGGVYLQSDVNDGFLDLSSQDYKVVAIQILADNTAIQGSSGNLTETENNFAVNANGVPTHSGIGFPNVPNTVGFKAGVIVFGRWTKLRISGIDSAVGKVIAYVA